MCGVVGYIGKSLSRKIVMEGLSRLEYRGYDTAGFVCLNPDDHRIMYLRSVGHLQNLLKKFDQTPIDGNVGIGHIRWATHGGISEQNAHPHFDCEKKVSIVHNGIIENHSELRKHLEAEGHVFHSQTDSEVIAHLFEARLASGPTSFNAMLVDLVNRFEGAYAFVALLQDFPDRLVMVRKRAPLCIGVGTHEMFAASDPLAFVGKTDQVLFMPDESFAVIKQGSIELYDFAGNPMTKNIQTLDATWVDHEKQGHEHFMLKEIYQQKNAIRQTLTFLQSLSDNLWDHLGVTPAYARDIDKLNLIACGTSWHAARIAQFFFESICNVQTRVHLASEFRYMQFFPDEKSLYITISQSGETADTLEALRLVSTYGLPTVALTNVPSSTMVREADGFLLTQAGQEVAVASTKAFSTQIAALYWLAQRLALEKGLITKKQLEQAEEDLLVAAEVLESSIENYKMPIMQTLAKKYAGYKKAIFLGRHISYPFALEAALKLKEISYIFAQCYPAGELKHGPLALVDGQTPIFIFSHQDPLIYQKLTGNAQEVKARGGHLIAFAFEGQEELCALADQVFMFPRVKPLLGPLAMTGLMQFFVYQIARELECSIDKPRNLAKSVTVE